MKTLNELLWDNEKTLDDWLDEIDKENPKPFSSGPSLASSCGNGSGTPSKNGPSVPPDSKRTGGFC